VSINSPAPLAAVSGAGRVSCSSASEAMSGTGIAERQS
jgi:hypothetical protein